MSGTASKRLNLSVQYASRAENLPARELLRTWVRAAMHADGPRGGDITLRFVDADEGLALNRDYRGKDYPTNVLSFIYDDGPRSAHCETCGFCAVSEAVMTASGEGRKRYTCMRCPDFVHATQGLARCNYWEARHEG